LLPEVEDEEGLVGFKGIAGLEEVIGEWR
jgi:hypothetical protein